MSRTKAKMERSDARRARPIPDEELDKPGQTTAEWVTLIVSFLIVAGVVGVLLYDLLVLTGNPPPNLQVVPHFDEVRLESDAYYLPITLINRGHRTAEDVLVNLVLAPREGEVENTSIQVRFLVGGERAQAMAIFSNNPAEGRLSHTISYLEP